MKVRIEVDYHPELENEFAPYVARVLNYPELQGYGQTPEEAVLDAKAFLEEHLGKPIKVLREELAVELA
jgi:predicted RNase H-like HicB family nuclease